MVSRRSADGKGSRRDRPPGEQRHPDEEADEVGVPARRPAERGRDGRARRRSRGPRGVGTRRRPASPASPATTNPPACTAAGQDWIQDVERGRVTRGDVEGERRRDQPRPGDRQRQRATAPGQRRGQRDHRGARSRERQAHQPAVGSRTARLLGHGTPWWSSGVHPHSRAHSGSRRSGAPAVDRNRAGANSAGSGPEAPVGADAGRVTWGGHRTLLTGVRIGMRRIVRRASVPRHPLDRGFSWGCNAAWPPCLRAGRRALEQLRLIADDASSAEFLADRALAVLDAAVPFDDGALFAVDEASLLFNRLLAYRGQAPEAMRAWLRDTYLVAREPGSLHVPTLLRQGGGAAAFHEDGDRWLRALPPPVPARTLTQAWRSTGVTRRRRAALRARPPAPLDRGAAARPAGARPRLPGRRAGAARPRRADAGTRPRRPAHPGRPPFPRTGRPWARRSSTSAAGWCR